MSVRAARSRARLPTLRAGLPRLRTSLPPYGFVLPAVAFLALFFILPMLSILSFSFGLDRLATSDVAAQFTGELTHFSTSLWSDLLGNDVSLSVLGHELGGLPLWCAAIVWVLFVVGIVVAPRHGARGRWIAAGVATLLVAPFLTIPAGDHLIRVAQLSSDDDALRLFFRSVTMAMTASACAVAIAFPLAYYLALVARRRRYTWLLVLLASFLASYLLRIFAWKLILGDQGVVAQVLGEGSTPSFLLYSQFTVILVLVYLWVPIVVLPIFVALDGIDARLLEAAGDLGASRLQTLRRVILPTAAPGIAAGFLLMFIPSLGEYATPSLVGGTEGFMFGQVIADDFVGKARNWQTGSMLAMLLLAVVLLVLWCSARAGAAGTGSSGDGGTGRWTASVQAMTASPRGRVALRLWFVAFMLFLYLPIAVLVLTSFNTSALPAFPPDGLGLHWYQRAWEEPAIRSALWASLRVGVCSALTAAALALLASYAITRRRLRGRTLVAAILTLPLVVPPVILGVSLLSLFNRGAIPIPLGLIAVGIAHVVFTLPYCVLILLPRLQALDRRLEEAAHDLGASWLTTFRRVLLPMLMPSLVAALIISFVLSMDEVVVASFLVQDQPTYPVYIFTSLRFPERTMLVLPVAAVMMVVSLALVGIAEAIRRVSERRLGVAA